MHLLLVAIIHPYASSLLLLLILLLCLILGFFWFCIASIIVDNINTLQSIDDVFVFNMNIWESVPEHILSRNYFLDP